MFVPFTVNSQVGIGSPGDLRPGMDSSEALSSSLPSASKASNFAGQPVEPHNSSVTEVQPLVNCARTGIGSSAIALKIPFLPDGGCGKNMSRALAWLLVGGRAGVNKTPLSVQESTQRPVISAFSKSITTLVWPNVRPAINKIRINSPKVIGRTGANIFFVGLNI